MVLYETCLGSGSISSAYELPHILTIEPLLRVSPSKFHLFRDCKLRACLESNKVPGLLPLSPSAHCGSVIHRIIEKAVRGKIKGEEDFDNAWKKCIENEEKKKMQSWTEKHLIPLEKSAKNYELKKYQCMLAVKHITSKYSFNEAKVIPQSRKSQEVWLESKDRTVGGYVDAIISTDAGDIIADYKTGNITESSEKSHIPH